MRWEKKRENQAECWAKNVESLRKGLARSRGSSREASQTVGNSKKRAIGLTITPYHALATPIHPMTRL